MGRRERRLALAIGVVALGVAPFLVGAAFGRPASHLRKHTSHLRRPASNLVALACGDTVTTSVTLTADITGCGGRGLSVGANGIVINLNGHEISGSGMLQGLFDPSFTGVVFENGTVSGFTRGVELDGGSATIKNLRITNNSGAGIIVFQPATISGNVIWGNGTGISVGCCASDKSTVTHNVVNDNGGDGIDVSFSAAGSTISSNHVLSNTGDGINVIAPNASVTNNIANANGGSGFDLNSGAVTTPPLTARSNAAADNTALGIILGAGDTDGGGNRAGGNGSQHQCENIVCNSAQDSSLP